MTKHKEKKEKEVGVEGPQHIGEWINEGCWNAKSNVIPTLIGSGLNINTCVEAANKKGYNTVALQNNNKCYGCNNCNFKQYGQVNNSDSKCNINKPSSDVNMVYTRTIGSSGYSCNYGNKLIPTIVSSEETSEGIITFPENYIVHSTQSECVNWMNNTLLPNEITCTNGTATNPQCKQLYKDLNLSTFSDMGFKVDNNITTSGSVIGKQDGYSYTCASYDNINCLTGNNNIHMQPLQELHNIKCESSNNINSNPKNLCQVSYDYYNLYPSTNPLVIRGLNIYQNITNTINDQNTLTNIANTYSDFIPNSNSQQGIINGINNVLQETPIKLGCCSRQNSSNNGALQVSIKVPISPSVANENNILKEFNFQKNILTIPENTCPTSLAPGSDDCNAFFGVYCENMVSSFNKLNLPNVKFTDYSPECACYAPKTGTQQLYPAGTPSQCYKDGCSPNTISYLDPSSRGQTCSMTVCQNIVNTAGLTAGGSANVSPTLVNNCGSQIPSSTNTPSTNTPSTNTPSTNTPSTNTTHKSSNIINDSNKNLFYYTISSFLVIVCIVVLFILIYKYSKR